MFNTKIAQKQNRPSLLKQKKLRPIFRWWKTSWQFLALSLYSMKVPNIQWPKAF